jgi:uroporphyrinogen decarboxylase
MNSWERFKRMYEHKEADRVPIIDQPWAGTIRRWHREGMPVGMDWRDYFGVDKNSVIFVDISPRFPTKIIEETDRYVISTTSWGLTKKSFKAEDSTPEMLDFKVTTAEAWEQAKARMTLEDNRIPRKRLEENFTKWRADGHWITAHFWFGFDVTHSWMMGTENLLIAMYEEPEMVQDMFNTYLDRCMDLFGQIWDAGYHFDCISWPDDMGYKGTTFFSNEMYREMLKPVHKRAIDWAHNRGIYAHLHSCGNIMSRIDDLMEIGLDALNPLEVKAGMEPLTLKKNYGDKLVLHGGINAVLWDDKEAIIEEIRRVIPALKENGGYIFSSDHSVPNSVSLENFRAIIEEIKIVGKY